MTNDLVTAVVCAAATGTVFAADLMLATGGAVAALYVAPVLYACRMGGIFAAVAAGAAAALTLLAAIVGPEPAGVSELVGRGAVVAALVAVAAVCHGPMRSDGSRRALESRVRDGERTVSHTRSVLKRAEVLRGDVERRYWAMFNQTFQLVALLSPEGRIEDANDTFLSVTALARAQVVGREVWDLPVWDGNRDVRGQLREGVEFAAAGSFFRTEAPLGQGGSTAEMILDISVKPIRNREGAVEMMILEARDVTEQRAQAAALARRERLNVVGQLASGIAHDVNNTLTVISGNLELVARRLDEGGRERRRVEQAIEAVFYGKSLTRRLLAFARRQYLVPVPLALDRVLGDICELLDPTLPDDVELDCQVPEDVWFCWADAGQLETAVMNLVLNSRDAMPRGGRIRIRVQNAVLDGRTRGLELASGDYLRISVIDDGEGIPPEILDRVMEPYFTTKGPDKGTGMGLSMVYGFARQSGGDLAIESRVGDGTTVHLYLPRAAKPEDGPDDDFDETVSVAAHILVIEDEAGVRDVVVSMLSELGYVVSAVRDGEAAVRMLEQDAPIDLILTDIMLPGAVGAAELVEAARRARPDMPVIYSSGMPEEARARLDIPLTGENFVGKPYRLAELKQIVARALGRGGAGGKDTGPSAAGRP